MAAVLNPQSVTSGEARAAAQQYLDSRLGTSKQSNGDSEHFVVPIIDISSSFSGSEGDKAAVAAKIREACLNSGFFQITGHGISPSSRQSILHSATRFFKTLTPSQKETLHIRHSPYMRGWEPADSTYVNPGDTSVPETKEGFNWGYEPSLDPTGGDGAYTELDGSSENGNVWPAEEELPGFFEGVRGYYAEVLDLARYLSGLFALSLGLRGDWFEELITHPGGIGRLLYYPPAKEESKSGLGEAGNAGKGDEEEVGLGAHSDYECFTILLSSMTRGLEILSPAGKWKEVQMVEDGLVVNIGDFFMRYTNDLYKSTVHRVVNRSAEERYSVPFFFSINYDQVVEPLPSCVSEQNPSRYPPISAGQYVLERLQATAADG